MRIIAGKRRGLSLAAVGKGDAAAHLRPTSDRVRESLFNLLSGGRFGDPVTHARVLDLFAGTGALGLEAWSRGAVQVTFVDDGRTAHTLIQTNIRKAGAEEATTLLRMNATRLPQNRDDPFDLVFLDPPYGKTLGQRALTAALAGNWIADTALIVWEENAAQTAPPGFTALETRRYGETYVTLLSVGTPPD